MHTAAKRYGSPNSRHTRMSDLIPFSLPSWRVQLPLSACRIGTQINHLKKDLLLVDLKKIVIGCAEYYIVYKKKARQACFEVPCRGQSMISTSKESVIAKQTFIAWLEVLLCDKLTKSTIIHIQQRNIHPRNHDTRTWLNWSYGFCNLKMYFGARNKHWYQFKDMFFRC